MKENKECFNMHKIFFLTWNIQNKIIIGHSNVELAMILSVFLFFQSFYWSVSTTSLWTSQRKKIAINGDLLLEPFKNKINNLFIYNSKK